MKLSSKASLLIMALVAVLFVPLSSIMIHFQKQALQAAAFKMVDNAAATSALLAASFREEAQREAEDIAAAVPAAELRQGRWQEAVPRIRKALGNHGTGAQVFLLDPGGVARLAWPALAGGVEPALTFVDPFQPVLVARRRLTGLPCLAPGSGRPCLAFLAPVLDAGGGLLAVVACAHDLLGPEAFGGVQGQRLGRTGYVFLVDHSRMLLLSPNPARILKRDFPPGANRVLDQALAGFEGAGATVNSQGVAMLSSFRRVPGTPWILGAQIPEQEAFEATRTARLQMLAATALSLLFILAVALVAVRRFTRPITQLHRAASTITRTLQGGANDPGLMATLAAIQGDDELATLARAFRTLVERGNVSLLQLQRAASEWEGTFNAVNEAILCLDREGRVLRMNRLAEDWFRTSSQAALGQPSRRIVLGEEPQAEPWPEPAGAGRTWTGALPGLEGIFEFQTSPLLREGAVQGQILAVRDHTTQARKEEQIRRQAFKDALTGLPNRLLLMDRLQQALAAGVRAQRGVGVLFLDLDHFKEVNDSLGHEAGDALLLEVVTRLRALLRKADTLARLGGDEFVLVLAEVAGREDAARVAGKIVQALGEPFLIQGQEVRIGTSIGIALAPGDGGDGPTLLKNADTAMYQAKREGRSTWRYFS